MFANLTSDVMYPMRWMIFNTNSRHMRTEPRREPEARDPRKRETGPAPQRTWQLKQGSFCGIIVPDGSSLPEEDQYEEPR